MKANMRFVLTAQAWMVILRLGRPAAQTLGRYKAEINTDRYDHRTVKAQSVNV